MNYQKGHGTIPMPHWVKPHPGWEFAGWFPRNPLFGTFEKLLEKAQQSDHGELRKVDIYKEGAACWMKEDKDEN